MQDPETGKTKFVEREKDELEQHVEQKQIEKLAKKGIIKRTKEEKRQEKRLKEKEKRMKKKRRLYKQNMAKTEDFETEDFSDKVQFNDIVHAPPSLKLPGVKHNEARRPGQSKDLLLLNPQKLKKNVNQLPSKPTDKDTKSKKKVKQRISLAKKQMLENDRISIVEQYRALKQKNYMEKA